PHQVCGGVTSLLAQFARRGLDWVVFVRVDQAAGDLERHAFGAVPELAHQDQFVLFGERDDVDPVGSAHEEEADLAAGARRAPPPLDDVEHLAAAEALLPDVLPVAQRQRRRLPTTCSPLVVDPSTTSTRSGAPLPAVSTTVSSPGPSHCVSSWNE